MGDSLNTQVYDSKRNKRSKKNGKSIWVKILLFIISMGLWGTTVYYGYINAKNYVDISINNVQQSNLMAVEQLKEEVRIVNSEIKILRDEIEDLKDDVRDADSTLTNANDIQEDIDKRLKYLDDKLARLQESLKVLEEAPNAKN